MPKEGFYDEEHNENPGLMVEWGNGDGKVLVHGDVTFRAPEYRGALNRLIRSLRRARNQTFGKDQ